MAKEGDESRSQEGQAKDELRYNEQQYELLRRCSEKKDMAEWNEWRKENPDKDICLQGGNFKSWWLEGANFMHGTCNNTEYSGEVHLEGCVFEGARLKNAEFFGARLERSRFYHATAQGASFNSAHLENAKLSVAHLEDCNFAHAFLTDANLVSSFLAGANFTKAKMRGCWVRCSVVSGASKFWKCEGVNKYRKYGRFTDFSSTALANVIIDPATKQVLEYNIRRQNWEEWYKDQALPKRCFVRWFFSMSDYGFSTWRIIYWFAGLAFLFAAFYWLRPELVVVDDACTELRGYFHAVYFSVVTMTTVGFGDIAANPDSRVGQFLLMVQVILGYVLLGALVTRFAVLFTAGGAAKRESKIGSKTGKDEKREDEQRYWPW